MSILPETLPELPRKQAKFFIDEWNRLYQDANEEQRIGLAVLAYRVDIHRYAAAMLIDRKCDVRLSGISILGYMRDESSWPILTALLKHPDKTVALTALSALFYINERRARDELIVEIQQRIDWNPELIKSTLQPICNTDFLSC